MRSDGQTTVGTIADRAGCVSVLDRLIARMEISRTYPFPVLSILLFWAGLLGLALIAKTSGTKPVLFTRICGTAWLLVVASELGRDIWAQRHRYASPRWLRAVNAAVGNDVTVHALADLIRRHEHNFDYVVTRSDLRSAVQAERTRRRDAARRAEGFRLIEKPEGLNAQTNADTERRWRVRERRAARQAQAGT